MASFFDHPYYKWNKIFLSYLGTWPEQSLFLRCLIPFLITSFLITIVVPEIIRLGSIWRDIDTFLECLPPFFTAGLSLVQLFNGSFNHNKFSEMLDHISSDWERLCKSPNTETIRKYASRGCVITKTYSASMYSAVLFYTMAPLLVPIVTDFVVPQNESREKVYLFEAEYGVNSDDYYWPIIAHMSLATYLVIVVIISNDVMFFIMIEHACALFEVAGINLEMVRSSIPNDGKSTEDNGYKMISHCIDLHREAIIFADLIESSYTFSFIGVIGFSLLILSITGLQVIMFFSKSQRLHARTLMHLDEPGEALRYGSFAIAQIFHLYFNSIPGQKLMDYSLSIFNYAYSVDWHDLTPKSQKLLIMIMTRSLRQSQITAGKIYIVSMENFSSVIQTSMSCFTVFSSMR